MSTGQPFTFIGGDGGAWRVVRLEAVVGDPLERVPGVSILDRRLESLPSGGRWLLRGVTGHERYVTRREHDLLVAKQPALDRPGATCAALIPIRKSPRWWSLAQDERRAILEERSEHIKTDAPGDVAAFEELVGILRRSEEWSYVEREIDIRLVLA